MKVRAAVALVAMSTTWNMPEALARSERAVAPACQDDGVGRDSFCIVDGVRLHFVDWGGRGPAIILLAGLGSSARVYDDFAPLLANGHRVIAVTRRGYGRSDQPANGDYSNDALVRDILGVMDGLAIRRASFVGHSIAGGELATLGADHPERVDRLVYLDAAYDRTRIPELMAGLPPLPPPTTAVLASFDAFAVWRERGLGVHTPAVGADLRQIMEPGPAGLVSRTPPAIGLKVLQGDIAATPRYEEITSPSLAIYTSKDVADQVPPGATEAARQAFIAYSIRKLRPWMEHAKAQFLARQRCGVAYEVPHSTHHIFLERRMWVARTILAYLDAPAPCSFAVTAPRDVAAKR